MRQFTKLLSALIVLVLATAFIGCGNPSSSGGNSSSSDNGGGNSNSPTYTTVAGGTYIDSSIDCGWIFYADNSVSQGTGPNDEIPMNGAKWRIGNGNTVEIYEELPDEFGGGDDVVYTFTATSDFTQLTLTMTGDVYIRQ